MKIGFLSILSFVSFGLSVTVYGGPKHPEKPAPASAQEPLAPDALPSIVLQPFLDGRLEKILAPLDEPGLKHPDAVADLRSSIADAMSKASPSRLPAFQAALAVCDLLQKAYDDRLAAIGNLQGAGLTSSSTSLGVVSKPNHLSNEQLHSEARAQQNATQTDAFFVNAHKSQWTQRAVRWRQSIQQLYLRERDIERQVTMPVVVPPAKSTPGA